MYLNPTPLMWAIDIEGDDLLSNVVHCLCAVNVMSGEEQSITGAEIGPWLTRKKAEGCVFIAHNGLGYDIPTVNRLLGTRLGVADVIDTMLMSMIYSPALAGGHSLAEWGRRLHYNKGEFNDFSRLTPEMLLYCMQDARLCRRIYLELVRRMNRQGFSNFGIEIEHRAWALIEKQKKNGFAFDIKNAHILYAKLRQIEEEIKQEIYAIWPPELKLLETYRKPYKKDSTPSANFQRHQEEYEKVVVVDDTYQCFGYVSFNIGSPDQRTEKLLELGWRPLPNELTPTGKPKPTVKGQLTPSLQDFVDKSGDKGPKLIAQWIEINSRANMINTWIEAFNENTGCIHGTLWLANTLRYRHSNPNTANIPAVRLKKVNDEELPLYEMDGVYTYEARNLWGTRNPVDRTLVGVDAKGIQLRVLAHYLNNEAFTKAVLDGDPHSYNQNIGGFRTRAMAKTFIYAFLLGAGDEKVGQIIGGSPKDGKEIKLRFVNNFPGLSELLTSLERQITRTGRIRLCDGTPLVVTQPHTRLGYLLQGDESRIMKYAAILVDRGIKNQDIDALKVGDIHDEWQYDVRLQDVQRFEELCRQSFAAAGRQFEYRVPIDCSSKVGKTWAETH